MAYQMLLTKTIGLAFLVSGEYAFTVGSLNTYPLVVARPSFVLPYPYGAWT